MTPRIEKTVFISYRRTNYWTALAVFQNLNANGYDVFLDYKSIPSGDFEQVITENVKSHAHFLVILSPSALERCHEPSDWLRREIETAIENRRNIIPLMMEGFDFGSPETIKALTGKLAELKKYNSIGIPAEYFDEAMVKLRSEKFLNRPWESVSHPVSSVTKEITETQKLAASEAKQVEKEQLSAIEWFERGFINFQRNNYDEAIHCFTEAIRLKPDFVEAYNNRGSTYNLNGQLENALEDYDKAIILNSVFSDAYYNRGVVYRQKGDLEKSILDFKEAFRIKPDYIPPRISLIGLLKKLGRELEAKELEVTTRHLVRKEIEYDQACFESICGNTDKALGLLKIALGKNQPFGGKTYARQDPDFENICDDPRFKELIGE